MILVLKTTLYQQEVPHLIVNVLKDIFLILILVRANNVIVTVRHVIRQTLALIAKYKMQYQIM